jgi:hypothetical protein
MKNINYKFLVFCFFLLLVSTFLLTGCGKKVHEVVEEEMLDESTQEVVEEKDEEKDEDEVEEEIVSGDFSKFSSENQEIGNIGNEVYKIVSFSEKTMEGFHRFIFEVEGERSLPNVTAIYRAELGAIRLLFRDIEEDKSDIGYQKSYEVNEKGVVQVFHNITPNENEEIYDIGVAKATEFLLHSEKTDEGKWKINLDVRYPGESDLEIDTGSDEFSSEEQNIEGAGASDGARITNYSYGVEENVSRFIWTVRGSETKPIPQVKARYNDDGELTVIFPDLDSDYIGSNSNEVELIGNLEKVTWSRVSGETIYRFTLKEKRDFRLKSSLSPNQVILEVE